MSGRSVVNQKNNPGYVRFRNADFSNLIRPLRTKPTISWQTLVDGLEAPQGLDKIVRAVFGHIADLEHGPGIVVTHNILPGTIVPDANQILGIAPHLIPIELSYFLAQLINAFIVHNLSPQWNQGCKRLHPFIGARYDSAINCL